LPLPFAEFWPVIHRIAFWLWHARGTVSVMGLWNRVFQLVQQGLPLESASGRKSLFPRRGASFCSTPRLSSDDRMGAGIQAVVLGKTVGCFYRAGGVDPNFLRPALPDGGATIWRRM